MAEQKDERTYIRLHDGMPDHPKVEALSDKAFRLLVSTWCWCSRHLTDGRVPIAVWRKRGSPKARRELVDAGLAEQHDDHVMMHDYLEHQRSAGEVEEHREAKRRAGALGNHNRWHVPRNVYDEQCPICVANGPQDSSQKGSQPRSQKESRRDHKTSPETETETETQFSSGHLGEGESPTERADEQPPNPNNPDQGSRPADRCERHLGDEHPPPCGKCADARRAAEAWDQRETERAERIARHIDAAIADPRQRCEHGADGGRFVHPITGKSATCAICRRRAEREAS